ncbi:probable G-protein coupled receptor 34 [Clytia hemisphaerica]|uniref:probable G-protein coupled receptor 34 n=1 Tax=Clytia hemisphaerica TaxID=252671 RepID=UPI0034D4562B|eukprot:TCONS_00071118-protein
MEKLVVYFTVTNSLISVSGILGNFISLYCLWKLKRGQGNVSLSNAEKLLLSLNIADLLKALIIIPYHIYYDLDKTTSTTKAVVNSYLMTVGFWTSSLIISLIALNRYIKITRAVFYEQISSKRMTMYTILILYIFVLLLPSIYFIDHKLKKVIDTIITFTTMVSMATFYILITKQIVRSNRSVRAAALNTLSDQMETRVNYNVLVLVAGLFFCFFYLFTAKLVFIVDAKAINYELHSKIGFIFISANSSINPVIYLLRHDSYRQILVNVFKTDTALPSTPRPPVHNIIYKEESFVVLAHHNGELKLHQNVEIQMFHENKQTNNKANEDIEEQSEEQQ